jgi:hypothetical protein
MVSVSSCGGNGNQSYSIDQVLNSFSTVAQQLTLDERQDIYPWWSEKISQGSVKHIKDADYYQIEFTGMSGTEVWGIDMNNSRIWPINDNAVLMAFALFCRSGEDPSADCQQWAQKLETKE